MYELIIVITISILSFSNVSGAPKYPLSDPSNKMGWTPYWSMWDEFNGNSLDTSKWVAHSPELHNYFWYYGRAPGLVSKQNVVVKNGRLYLYSSKTRPIPEFYKSKGFNTFTVSMVHSKTKIKYGYSEIKAKIGNSRISSSFWFWGKTDTDATEFDVFEQSGPLNALERNYYHRLHSNRYIHKLKGFTKAELPAKCKCNYGNGAVCHDTPIGNTWGSDKINSFSDDWHVYGVHWTSQQFKIYVDGKHVITMNNDCNKHPVWLFLNRATMPNWFGVPPKSDIPDQPFQIEYVRTWKQNGAFTEEDQENVNHHTTTYISISLVSICICICIGAAIFIIKRRKRGKVEFNENEEEQEKEEEEEEEEEEIEVDVDIEVEEDGVEMETQTIGNALSVADDSD